MHRPYTGFRNKCAAQAAHSQLKVFKQHKLSQLLVSFQVERHQQSHESTPAPLANTAKSLAIVVLAMKAYCVNSGR